jgi:methanethiol S-methyltransferase
VAFTCTLWTAPVLTADRLLLASAWTLYCLIGPLHKERRLIARDPDGYCRYRASVPYWLPRLSPRRLEH